jgi:hypothetical protein
MKGMADDTLTRIFAVVLISVGLWMWFSAPAKAKKDPVTTSVTSLK